MPALNPSELVPGVWPMEGEALVYRVKSKSRVGMEHRVDLSAFGGGGECGCEAWDFRCRKPLRNGEAPSEELECPHVKLARRYYSFEMIQKVLRVADAAAAMAQTQSAARAVDRGVKESAA
jgi:hypothetical protein